MRFVLAGLAAATLCFAQRSVPIENERVRVLSVVDTPSGRKGPMHEHKMDRVMVYLDEGLVRLTYQDGRVVNRKVKPGMVVWDPKLTGMHQSENPGTNPVRIIEVELKGEPKPFRPPALDPVKVYSKGYKVELDNEQVRVVRAKFDRGAKIPLHEHVLNRVNVYLQPQKMRITPEGGAPTEVTTTQGEVRLGTAARHTEENLGDGTFELLMIELK